MDQINTCHSGANIYWFYQWWIIKLSEPIDIKQKGSVLQEIERLYQILENII